jgi:hypothetical protein
MAARAGGGYAGQDLVDTGFSYILVRFFAPFDESPSVSRSNRFS